uniref:Uncharacterized protein n=1 Tax=Triticum urartu TaxID=4572 RepID=A0A8R7TRY3_TRIUA
MSVDMHRSCVDLSVVACGGSLSDASTAGVVIRLLLVSIRKRGCTTVKMLNPMETAKFRLIVKQAKALKICNNHLLHTKKRQPAATWFGRAVNCLS